MKNAEHYIHPGTSVIVPARVCAYLMAYAGLDKFRLAARGHDADVDAVLGAFHAADLAWRSAASGTRRGTKAEPPAESEWLSTSQAAVRLRISPRGVRTAIATGRLQAVSTDGRWRISREAIEHFRRGNHRDKDTA